MTKNVGDASENLLEESIALSKAIEDFNEEVLDLVPLMH